MPGSAPLDATTVAPAEGDAEVYHAQHDMSTDGLALTISVALAEITGRPETELVPAFSKHADPDALNRLFRTRPNGEPRREGHVRLHVAGFEVTVESDGHITFRRTDVGAAASAEE